MKKLFVFLIAVLTLALMGCGGDAPKKDAAAPAGGDKQVAQQVFVASQRTIDSIADKKIIHKNKAARHKSRLSSAIKAMGAAAAA